MHTWVNDLERIINLLTLSILSLSENSMKESKRKFSEGNLVLWMTCENKIRGSSLLDLSSHTTQVDGDDYPVSISFLDPQLNSVSFLLGLLLCFELRTSINFSSSLENGKEEYSTEMISCVLHFYLHTPLLQVK